MLNAAVDTDVLIVGAGPVGLFLANECARRGLRWRLVEARASQSGHSKALAIFPRTLEIFDMAGLVGPFLEAANRVTRVAIGARGQELARVGFAPEESAYPFIAMVPQNVTERLLLAQLQSGGGAIAYETSFVGASDRGDHVEVTLEHEGQRSTLRASFVVGCDGAHSSVRHLLEMPFVGEEYGASFMLADIETNDALVSDELQLYPNPSGPLAIFPMGADRARIVAMVAQAEGNAPSLELVRKLLQERVAGQLEARALHWSSYFRVHHRQAAKLRVGRIFLAGDAAHIHSPFGGQGMNTGLHDVWNLAWKLELAVRGLAGEALLDSYGAERLPVISEVIETTHRLTRVMGARSRLAQAVRGALIPLLSRSPWFQHRVVTRLSGLGVEYGHSPIVDGSGKRCFDDSMRRGDGIDSRFLLLGNADGDRSTQEALRQWSESWRDVVELRLVKRDGILLVRPDGYIACEAPSRDVTAALRRVSSVLERQISHNRVRHGRPTSGPSSAWYSSAEVLTPSRD